MRGFFITFSLFLLHRIFCCPHYLCFQDAACDTFRAGPVPFLLLPAPFFQLFLILPEVISSVLFQEEAAVLIQQKHCSSAIQHVPVSRDCRKVPIPIRKKDYRNSKCNDIQSIRTARRKPRSLHYSNSASVWCDNTF